MPLANRSKAPLCLAACLLFAAVCCSARTASAAPPGQTMPPRRGLYLHAAMGPDAMSGKVSYGGPIKVAGTLRSYSYQADFDGLGADVDLAAGWAFLDGLAIALEGRDVLQMTGSAKFPHSTLSNLSLQSLGGLVDYYPRPRGPLHVSLGLGYARDEYSSEEALSLSPDTIVVHSDDMNGVLGHASVGYEWRAKTGFQFGPLLDVWITRLASKQGRTNARGASLMISAGWM